MSKGPWNRGNRKLQAPVWTSLCYGLGETLTSPTYQRGENKKLIDLYGYICVNTETGQAIATRQPSGTQPFQKQVCGSREAAKRWVEAQPRVKRLMRRLAA